MVKAKTPTPGRIVLVKLGDAEFPAIVQGVNSDGAVRATVFFGATPLFKSALLEQPDSVNLLDYHWRWPVP